MAALLAALLFAQSPDPAGELARGRAAIAEGDLAGAIAALSRVARAFPTWGLAQIELADALVQEGTDETATEAALAAARETAPGNPRTWMLCGRESERRERVAEAVECYGRAVAIRPDLVALRERMGILLAHAGHHPEAVPHLRAWLEVRPDDRAARANLAESLEARGDLSGAEVELRALADSEGAGTVYRRRLARFYERAGWPDKAREESKKVDAPRPERKLRPLPPSKH